MSSVAPTNPGLAATSQSCANREMTKSNRHEKRELQLLKDKLAALEASRGEKTALLKKIAETNAKKITKTQVELGTTDADIQKLRSLIAEKTAPRPAVPEITNTDAVQLAQSAEKSTEAFADPTAEQKPADAPQAQSSAWSFWPFGGTAATIATNVKTEEAKPADVEVKVVAQAEQKLADAPQAQSSGWSFWPFGGTAATTTTNVKTEEVKPADVEVTAATTPAETMTVGVPISGDASFIPSDEGFVEVARPLEGQKIA